MHKALVIFLAVYLTSTSVSSDHWHYPPELPNGVLSEDEDWGGNCANGKRQSPVDLVKDAAIKGVYPNFIFENYDQPIHDPTVLNNGHSIQISTNSSNIAVSGGGLPGTYVFDQMHFHWASEHLINNTRFALELHMVHHDKKYESINKAASVKNGIAVLGVLFHVTVKPNEVIENLLVSSSKIFGAAGKTEKFTEDLKLSELLPKKLTNYYRYEGSLTTPSCGEAVVWTVFEHSIAISMDQLEMFKTVIDDEGHELTHNYRHIQPLNSRALIYVKSTEDNSGALNVQLSLPLFLLSAVFVASIFY